MTMKKLYLSNYEQILKDVGYRYHHTASSYGYVTRRFDIPLTVAQYEGRFGKGVKVFIPRFDTTRFSNVEYWIKENTNDDK